MLDIYFECHGNSTKHGFCLLPKQEKGNCFGKLLTKVVDDLWKSSRQTGTFHQQLLLSDWLKYVGKSC